MPSRAVSSGVKTIELACELAHASPFSKLLQREAMLGNLGTSEMETYIRKAAVIPWHGACTANYGLPVRPSCPTSPAGTRCRLVLSSASGRLRSSRGCMGLDAGV